MSDYPEQVQRLQSAIQGLAGVRDVEFDIHSLEGLGEKELSLPGEIADLPHLALRRTKGGQKHEFLVAAEIWFLQNQEGWVALEFLAWWVRDLSRGGHHVQMRPLALPPVAYGTQLGRTLKFVIEFFFVNRNKSEEPILEKLGELAESLEENKVDYAKALKHPTQADYPDVESLRRSAENEDSAAQLELARRLEQGEGIEQDEAEAYRWTKKAAKHGHPDAKLGLGLCYSNGTGVKASHRKAFECYQESAEMGHPLAMGMLGYSYENGRGVGPDLAKAAEWYRQGAEAGEASCQAEFGECCEQGKGVPQDLEEALNWYRQALEQGFEDVVPAIERVEAAMRSEAAARPTRKKKPGGK
ncbi:tetratricopeptide repeat protein [Zavarzinella formosa]|uniref:tetratricopeptide repeat protein n=1 Tax=Zavarzinella formosa TaxID=360055 RepID=UPI0012F73BF7|nr:tetratricopeptide repeat protein [Zavarzinella formosa]